MLRKHQQKTVFNHLLEFIFYSNFFYGICTVAVMLETTFLMKIPFQGFTLYLLTFIGTIIFYNYPYARSHSPTSKNPRTRWYSTHHKMISKIQIVLNICLLALVIWMLIVYFNEIKAMTGTQWILLLSFPIIAAMYYGKNIATRAYNLRKAGLVKPFIIGLVWAGLTTIYPVLYSNVIHSQEQHFTLLLLILFLKNFMFISLLAIMFDVKDYADDTTNQLNTFVVKYGLRNTLFNIILPLIILGILTFISYALMSNFSIPKMIFILIPFLLLVAVTLSLKKRRPLMYYLVVIDGLIFVKAIFGILAAVS